MNMGDWMQVTQEWLVRCRRVKGLGLGLVGIAAVLSNDVGAVRQSRSGFVRCAGAALSTAESVHTSSRGAERVRSQSQVAVRQMRSHRARLCQS
jgi:hypothetical protein